MKTGRASLRLQEVQELSGTAALLTDEELILGNLPRLADVDTFGHLLNQLGVSTSVAGARGQELGTMLTEATGVRFGCTLPPLEEFTSPAPIARAVPATPSSMRTAQIAPVAVVSSSPSRCWTSPSSRPMRLVSSACCSRSRSARGCSAGGARRRWCRRPTAARIARAEGR